MRIKWEVSDGYIGKSRPQQTEIPEEDIRKCDTLDEAMCLIEDYIGEDYENLGWEYTNYDDVINEVKILLGEEANENA